jgi:hypothetical protein
MSLPSNEFFILLVCQYFLVFDSPRGEYHPMIAAIAGMIMIAEEKQLRTLAFVAKSW